MLSIECPSCKTIIQPPPDSAGKTINCSKCRKPVAVPPEGSANLFKYGIIAVVALVALFFVGMYMMPPDTGNNPVVVMETSKGTIKIVLYKDKAPITVDNFLRYVDEKHYDGTIFHRVIADFMIQGGAFEPGMRQKVSKHAPIRNEAGNGLSNERGTIAMARTNDPDSATDQFFINVDDNKKRGLDRDGRSAGYAVFGKILEGMDVVDAIRVVRTGNAAGHDDVPVDDVMIKSVRRVDAR